MKYPQYHILFKNGKPLPPAKIYRCINTFSSGYFNIVHNLIWRTELRRLDRHIFLKNAAEVLSGLGMTRSGPFQGVWLDHKDVPRGRNVRNLKACWERTRRDLLSLRRLVNARHIEPGSRTLIRLREKTRKKVISELWRACKKLLPITMGKASHGLAGASHILFSAFPELVLPVDNAQWRLLFRTVDLGDVVGTMADEIVLWEKKTRTQLEWCDTGELTTVTAVYHVMARNAVKRLY